MTIADIRSVALKGFGNAAQAYARGRPDYPNELLNWLRRDLQIGPGKTVIDLGAGTGKFTKLLLQTDARVIAVEPVDAMRAELAASLPAVQVIAGTAQSTALSDGTADAAICAQAFHWFATDLALAEIHRVLKPGGRLGLVWNVRDDSVDWVAAITEIITPHEGDAPRYYKGDWRRPFDGRFFTDLVESRFPYKHLGTAQQVILDRILSVSFIAALPDDERLKVAAQLNDLISTHPELRGRETISFPYETHAYGCSRKPVRSDTTPRS
jgi:ubiquinone/menaquinone biosynthesis C-methylase UbiE